MTRMSEAINGMMLDMLAAVAQPTESYAVFYSGGKLRLDRPAGGWVESAERMGQATQLNCAEARRMLRLRYRQVRTVECSGRVYTFRAVTKAGQRIRVKVNAPKGWWVM